MDVNQHWTWILLSSFDFPRLAGFVYAAIQPVWPSGKVLAKIINTNFVFIIFGIGRASEFDFPLLPLRFSCLFKYFDLWAPPCDFVLWLCPSRLMDTLPCGFVLYNEWTLPCGFVLYNEWTLPCGFVLYNEWTPPCGFVLHNSFTMNGHRLVALSFTIHRLVAFCSSPWMDTALWLFPSQLIKH